MGSNCASALPRCMSQFAGDPRESWHPQWPINFVTDGAVRSWVNTGELLLTWVRRLTQINHHSLQHSVHNRCDSFPDVYRLSGCVVESHLKLFAAFSLGHLLVEQAEELDPHPAHSLGVNQQPEDNSTSTTKNVGEFIPRWLSSSFKLIWFWWSTIE